MNRMRFNNVQFAGAAIFFLLVCSIMWPANQTNSKSFTLSNGLEISLQERDKLHLVHIAAGIDVGSKNESPDTNGLIHLLEHLVFLGSSESHGGEEWVTEVRRRGGRFNAHTDRDFMTLEISLPAGHLDFVLNFVKEKVFALKLIQGEADREKKIILKEIDRIMDDPKRSGTHLVLQELFNGHPYGLPLFGDKEVIKNATVTQLYPLYKRFFTPANCSLSIVGDFKLAEAEKKIRIIFGEIKNSSPAKPKPGILPCKPLKKNIEIKKEMAVEHAYVVVGFPAPPFLHADYFSMDLLSHILGQGFNPLLYRALSGRRRLAEGLSTRYLPFKYGGAFLVYITTTPGHSKTVHRNLVNFFKKTRRFRYAKTDFLQRDRPYVFDYLESAENLSRLRSEQANEEGLLTAISFAKYLLLTDEEIRHESGSGKVEAEQLRDAAGKYLSGKKYVVLYVVPGKKKAVVSMGNSSRQNDPGTLTASRDSAQEKAPVNRERTAGQSGWLLPPCKQIEVNDNLRFIFTRDRSSAASVIKLFIKGGKNGEPGNKRGLAAIAAGLTIAIPEAVQTGKLMELGTIFSSQVYEDYSVITIKCLSENLRESLGVLAGVMKKPLFSPLRIRNVKRNLESRQKSEQEDTEQLLDLIVRNTFFPGSHYSGSIYGDRDSLKEIKKKDVVDFYKTYMNAANMVLSVCSDMDEAQIKRIINAFFSGFPAGEAVRAEPVKMAIPGQEKPVVTAVKEQKQNLVCFAFLLPRITPGHFARAFVLEDLLGKGVGSRLWRLRSEQGLAYGFEAGLTQFRDAGILKVYAATSSKEKDRASGLLKKIIADLRDKGIGAAELETAKIHAKAGFLKMNETKENRALYHGYFETLGLGFGFVNDFFARVDRITLKQMNDYVKKVFAPGSAVEIRIGPGL